MGIDMYDAAQNERIADQFEAFLEEQGSLFVLEDRKKESIKKARKIVKKAIKNLRKNKPEEVFDVDRFEEYASRNSF